MVNIYSFRLDEYIKKWEKNFTCLNQIWGNVFKEADVMDSRKQSPLRNSITSNEEEERKLANPIQQTIVINTLNMVQSESQEHASGEYGAGNQCDEDEGDFDDEKIRPRF
ncbi:hypothetical protein Glove_29g172 [Diversispora epigaea]|uniref:Uncharacterized protein n=1 Tax=Diversispora epigaea TaxID=1348612 RepID=A0A397JM66_9GLOM|nr:hypothetical protein Glove_29g172 [Diversispora epigaea]